MPNIVLGRSVASSYIVGILRRQRTPGGETCHSAQAAVKLYYGRVRASRELLQADLDAITPQKGSADLQAGIAFEDAMLGQMKGARQHADASLHLGGEPAMALALLGDAAQVSNITEKWTRRAAEGGFGNGIWIPELQAALEIKRGNPTRALELLGPVKRYEAGWIDQYMAAYLRGQAYLADHRGPEAAMEFQKILDHRGVVLTSLIGSLARVGLARAYALQGNAQQARASYENFFELWRDADKDIPILISAKSEYAKLH